LRNSDLSPEHLRGVMPRAEVDVGVAIQTVQPLLDEVRLRGAEGLKDQAERFDRVRPASLRVPAEVIEAAERDLDPSVKEALVEAIARARAGHAAQLPQERRTQIAPG